jgi:hypothetical protein
MERLKEKQGILPHASIRTMGDIYVQSIDTRAASRQLPNDGGARKVYRAD